MNVVSKKIFSFPYHSRLLRPYRDKKRNDAPAVADEKKLAKEDKKQSNNKIMSTYVELLLHG